MKPQRYDLAGLYLSRKGARFRAAVDAMSLDQLFPVRGVPAPAMTKRQLLDKVRERQAKRKKPGVAAPGERTTAKSTKE